MGKIAADFCDVVVLTSDNPRIRVGDYYHQRDTTRNPKKI